MFQWLVTGAALVAAAAALLRARRLARRLERLTEAYWELRYEQGQLKARLTRLDPESPDRTPDAGAPRPGTSFIPLSTLKK